jgi:DNA (cytosine-5)-methyltransferase 1
MDLRYVSVCSGIEAASVAWHRLGWKPLAFSEIDKFPSAVLKHHYPDVPNRGDFTTIGDEYQDNLDVLIGGTPCQEFSIANINGRGLDSDRGNLTLEFVRLINRNRPSWVVWENVANILTKDGGKHFGGFLVALQSIGYGVAWRVLDAQYFGVPQRRRRVFLVASPNAKRAAQVLFDSKSLSGDSEASRASGQSNSEVDTNGATSARSNDAHGVSAFTDRIAQTLTATDYKGVGSYRNGSIRNVQMVNGVLRRLTPLEGERLQGFPDNYTLIPYRRGMSSDSARYKAIGNSMAVPVIEWLGRRIELVESSLL